MNFWLRVSIGSMIRHYELLKMTESSTKQLYFKVKHITSRHNTIMYIFVVFDGYLCMCFRSTQALICVISRVGYCVITKYHIVPQSGIEKSTSLLI